MIKIKNVYWMLAYAFNILNEKEIKNIETEEFDNIYDLLATILVKGVNKQLKKGLNKEYVLKEEEMFALKGKIKLSDTIKYNVIRQHKMICEYDEFSINTYLNQIIKITLLQLLKTEKLKREYKLKIKKIMLYFKEVDIIDYTTINWAKLNYNKNNLTYKMIINICYLILEGLILTEEKGEIQFMTFIDDQKMSKLFEKFVKEYYCKHFPQLKPKSSHINWDIGEGELIGLLPDMKTDITLTYKKRNLIIDTKYYAHTLQNNTLYHKKTMINQHINQIYTYVKNRDRDNMGNVEGILLYAKTDEETMPNQVNTVSKNKFIFTSLDLTDSFEKVIQKLDKIVYDFTNHEIKKVNIKKA